MSIGDVVDLVYKFWGDLERIEDEQNRRKIGIKRVTSSRYFWPVVVEGSKQTTLGPETWFLLRKRIKVNFFF